MSFCLNPACAKPDNPDTNKFCHGCGSKLAESSQSYDFDHYRIIKLLGEGGFGRTYLAEDTELFNKKVVIKKLLSSEGNNPKILELFTREAEQLSKLSHPQIPQVYRYFSKDNNFYLIQEFIPGENLLTEVERLGNFNETQIREILLQILAVLEYIQSQDILHRDIKPENIMRRRSDNQLMLIDFGAVRVKTTTDPSVLTSIYTPGYASREQMNARPVKASDIYSLGVTCIRLLTGCFPTGTTDLIYDDYESRWTWKEYLQQKNITIDNKLAEIIDKMVEESLKKRYQDAREVREDLLATIGSQSQLSTPVIMKQKERILTGHSGWLSWVNSVNYSPDGHFLASGSNDNTIKIWSIATGEEIRTLIGHSSSVKSVVYSPDGNYLASGSSDKTIKIWEVETGKLICTLTGHSGWVNSVNYSPDSRYLASCSSDKTIRIWSIATGEEIRTLIGHSS
ncbi:MAG: serine/threonine protein kinase, partial [Gloeocapsa sp. DLM2.Bin57]